MDVYRIAFKILIKRKGDQLMGQFKNRMGIMVLLLVMIGSVFLFTGCGKSSSSGDSTVTPVTTTTTGTTTTPTGNASTTSVQLSGTIAGAGGAAAFRSMSAAPPVTDAVWAVPIAKMQGANIDPVNFMLRKTSAISTGGTFSFTLEKTMTMAEIKAKVPTIDAGGYADSTVFDVDWMLVKMAGVSPVGVIALQGDATYDTLLSIPLSAFTPTTLQIGTVDATSGVATLSVSSLASNVTMSASSLVAMARMDDILGTIKDVIRNCDIANNKCKSAQQSFVFTGVYSALAGTAAYDIGGKYEGYQLYFDLNDYYTKTDFDAICPISGPPTVVYTLAPPQPLSVQSVTYSIGSPLTTGATATGVRSDLNSGAYTQCFKNTEPLYFRKSNTTNDWHLQFVTGDRASQLITAFPSGDWVLSRNSTTVAVFEFSLAKPVDASGKPIIIVPAVQLVLDGTVDKGINAINVRWYQWSGTAYVQVTDTALLNSLMGGFEISMDDMYGITGDTNRRSLQTNGIDFATSTIDVSAPSDGKGKFHYNSLSTSIYNLDYMGVGYQFGGQSFRFAWATYL